MTTNQSKSILHIVGSPQGNSSTSTKIARAFIEGYQASNPEHVVNTLDVWTSRLPFFGAELAHAKLAPLTGESITEAQELMWNEVEEVIRDFDCNGKIIISTPMWNFSVPHQLKHYIDILVQPLLTFGVNEKGEHIGLLADRPVQLILSRSSAFPKDSPEDFQLSYLTHVLSFMGLKNIQTIVLEGTTVAADEREKLIDQCCARARDAGASF